MHVKPEHLDGRNGPVRDETWREPSYWAKHPELLRGQRQFFRACAKSGFRTVVANFRPNLLETDISNYELPCQVCHGRNHVAKMQCVKQKAERQFCMASSTERWDNFIKKFMDGIAAAEEAGLKVVRTNFVELTNQTDGVPGICRVFEEIMNSSKDLKQRMSDCRRIFAAKASKTDPKNQNGWTSERRFALQQRVGSKAAQCLWENMHSSKDPQKYTWMYNITDEVPPLNYWTWFQMR